MILWIINIVCMALGVIAYCIAPEGYDYTFCASLATIYIVQNSCWLLLNKHTSNLGFELFFMISFFFVNFAYPVIYAPVHAQWSFFMMDFDRHVINQATALAYLAYTWYMIGICGLRWKQRQEPQTSAATFPMSTFRIFCGIAIVGFILFVALGGYSALKDVYSEGKNLRDVGVYSYFNNIFSIGALLMAATIFRIEKQRHWGYLVLLVAFVIILLSTGSRQFSISLVIILLMCYSWYVYRLKNWQIACALLIGVVTLYLIVQMRHVSASWQDISSSNYVSMFDIFEDLSVNAINLYALTSWGNNHDLSWFQGMLLDLTSPVPKLGTWLVERINIAPELLHGGDLPSYILLGQGACWGTGTNMVGEAYRSFGVIGMCAVMLGIGALIREAYYRSGDSIYWNVFYLLMVGHAVIYPRAPLLYDPRTIVWTMLLLFVAQYVTNYIQALVEKWGKEEVEV